MPQVGTTAEVEKELSWLTFGPALGKRQLVGRGIVPVCAAATALSSRPSPPASDTSSQQHEATLVAVVAENAAGCVQGSAQWHLQNYLHTARFTTTHSCEGGGSSTSLLEQEVIPSSTESPLLHVPSRPHPHSRGVQLGAPTVWWRGMTALHGHRQTLKHSSAVAQVVGCALRQM